LQAQTKSKEKYRFFTVPFGLTQKEPKGQGKTNDLTHLNFNFLLLLFLLLAKKLIFLSFSTTKRKKQRKVTAA
jgi:hypothetical protein